VTRDFVAPCPARSQQPERRDRMTMLDATATRPIGIMVREWSCLMFLCRRVPIGVDPYAITRHGIDEGRPIATSAPFDDAVVAGPSAPRGKTASVERRRVALSPPRSWARLTYDEPAGRER
jgi:hypothetical protein